MGNSGQIRSRILAIVHLLLASFWGVQTIVSPLWDCDMLRLSWEASDLQALNGWNCFKKHELGCCYWDLELPSKWCFPSLVNDSLLIYPTHWNLFYWVQLSNGIKLSIWKTLSRDFVALHWNPSVNESEPGQFYCPFFSHLVFKRPKVAHNFGWLVYMVTPPS